MGVRSVLTLNTGSSSIKAAIYSLEADPQLRLTAEIVRIGQTSAELRLARPGEERRAQPAHSSIDHRAAAEELLAAVDSAAHRSPDAIGHRLVHGGSEHGAPELVSAALLESLRALVPLAPEHLPQAIATMEATQKRYPRAPQVACFDTAFHHAMPPVARRYPLPRWLDEEGIRRYGFHGLSYESIVAQLKEVGPAAAAGRVVLAHLGNGASAVAVRDGRSIDTTMGFTPTGGLMMGTRTGDLDPGVLVHVLRRHALTPEALSALVAEQSGLLGVSETTADMQTLLDREATDDRAREAIELFCYQVRKHIGALVAVLGGLQTLVFTGGIGENAAPVRARICTGLDFLGIAIDPDRNAANSAIVSPDGGAVTVRVMPAEEDRMIARHTFVLLKQQGALHV
jgi:acetate kinase